MIDWANLFRPQVVVGLLALASINSLLMWRHMSTDSYTICFVALAFCFFAESCIRDRRRSA